MYFAMIELQSSEKEPARASTPGSEVDYSDSEAE